MDGRDKKPFTRRFKGVDNKDNGDMPRNPFQRTHLATKAKLPTASSSKSVIKQVKNKVCRSLIPASAWETEKEREAFHELVKMQLLCAITHQLAPLPAAASSRW